MASKKELKKKIARLEQSLDMKNQHLNELVKLQNKSLALNDSIAERAAKCSMELVDLQGKISKIYLVVSGENTIFNRQKMITIIKQILK